jgi:hypothetical protein
VFSTKPTIFIPGLLLLLASSTASLADVPESQALEIDYLISYLQTSDCQMIRNGKAYSGEDGAKHVRRKYDHFRDKISSTEEFIGYAATESTMSGRLYEVQCPGEAPVSSSAWLLKELEVYRVLHR